MSQEKATTVTLFNWEASRDMLISHSTDTSWKKSVMIVSIKSSFNSRVRSPCRNNRKFKVCNKSTEKQSILWSFYLTIVEKVGMPIVSPAGREIPDTCL